MNHTIPVHSRLQDVHQRISQAAQKFGRDPHTLTLVAVTKGWPSDTLAAALAAGQHRFAESYLQEALPKIAALATDPVEWHFIGSIQANKTREIAHHFDWVHSLDRLKVAQRLSEQRPPGQGPLQVCIQVNIGAETRKAGVRPHQLKALAEAVSGLPRLRLRGLMAIPVASTDFQQQRQAFREVRLALENLQRQGLKLDTLSMGMSADLEAAIAEGATLLRLGSAIFGSRLK